MIDGVLGVYGRLGFEHILDPAGYDHILFLAALCAAYSWARWMDLVVLVTAFTLGHSVALVLATLGIVRADTGWVEFLIPVTIVLTAIVNVVVLRRVADAKPPRRERLTRYGLALGFGLIHGLGFSNFLRLVLGGEEDLVWPLLAFNLGLEVGQLFIALGILFLAWIAGKLGLSEERWTLLVSFVAGAMALGMAATRLPF